MVTNREMSYFKRILQQVQVSTQSRTAVSLMLSAPFRVLVDNVRHALFDWFEIYVMSSLWGTV